MEEAVASNEGGIESLREVGANLSSAQMPFDMEIAFARKLSPYLIHRPGFGRQLKRSFDDVHAFHGPTVDL